MLGLAVVGVLISGHDTIGSVTINPAALLAGLGVAAVGAAIITAVSLTELDNPLLHHDGLVVDLGRLVYLGGVTGALVAGHGVATPLWVLYVPVLLTTAFIDIVVKAIAYAIGASGLTLLATGVSHGFNKGAVVPLMLILAGLPAVVAAASAFAQSVNGVADAAHAERARQIEEVEQLREQLIEGHRAERETLLDETRR